MKSTRPYIVGVVFLIVSVTGYVVYDTVKGFDEPDLCDDHDYGLTTLRGQVLDTLLGKPIDSVEISLVYGTSWDHYLDTVIKHNDTLIFTFDAPRDCESYFYTIDTKYYWFDHDNHPAYNVGVKKGAGNDFKIYLKPATFFKISADRDTSNTNEDVLQIKIRKDQSDLMQDWGSISRRDFKEWHEDDSHNPYQFSDSGPRRTVYKFLNMESNMDYDVLLIRSNLSHYDTILQHVTANPFDTVSIHYTFHD